MISILLVDDDAAAIDVGSRILKKLGYEVTSVDHSLEALELFRRNPLGYDLVITDYSMPGMKGDELASKIRLIRTNIPIILCTGNNRLPKSEFQKWGIDELLLKPYRSEEINHILTQVLLKQLLKETDYEHSSNRGR